MRFATRGLARAGLLSNAQDQPFCFLRLSVFNQCWPLEPQALPDWSKRLHATPRVLSLFVDLVRMVPNIAPLLLILWQIEEFKTKRRKNCHLLPSYPVTWRPPPQHVWQKSSLSIYRTPKTLLGWLHVGIPFLYHSPCERVWCYLALGGVGMSSPLCLLLNLGPRDLPSWF